MFEIREIGSQYINELYAIQQDVFEEGYDENLLRKNSLIDFQNVFYQNHLVLGAFLKDRLVAFAILLINPSNNELIEKASSFLQIKKNLNLAVAKVIIVKKQYRGHGLQQHFLKLFEKFCFNHEIEMIVASVSPLNIYSLHNFKLKGFKIVGKSKLYGGYLRYILFKKV